MSARLIDFVSATELMATGHTYQNEPEGFYRIKSNPAGRLIPLSATDRLNIINELITNALKYAFPREQSCPDDKVGRILVTITLDQDFLH